MRTRRVLSSLKRSLLPSLPASALEAATRRNAAMNRERARWGGGPIRTVQETLLNDLVDVTEALARLTHEQSGSVTADCNVLEGLDYVLADVSRMLGSVRRGFENEALSGRISPGKDALREAERVAEGVEGALVKVNDLRTHVDRLAIMMALLVSKDDSVALWARENRFALRQRSGETAGPQGAKPSA